MEADNNLACQRNDSCTLELELFVVVTKAHRKVKKVSLLLLQGVSLSIPWRSENSLSTTHSSAAIHVINFNEVWLFYSDKS